MGKGSKHKYNTDQEFPVLASLGLYAGSIIGDGNCMFRALSDQLWGHQEDYAKIRSSIIAQILADKERYEPFTCVYGETFDTYVKRMGEDGTYGGHLEIVAFSEVYKAQVIIYQENMKYAVNPTGSTPDVKVHIAYHTWEHYSSVRNKAGPYTGLPEVDPVPCEVDMSQNTDATPQWQVDIVMRSVYDVSEEKVRQLLARKDYNQVIEDLLLQSEESEAVVEPETIAAESKITVDSQAVVEEPEEPSTIIPIKESVAKVKGKASKKKKDFEKKWAKKKEKAAAKNGKGNTGGASSASGANSSSSSTAASNDPIFI